MENILWRCLIFKASDEIDVNVHPSKSQIRFKDSSVIFKLVESSIRSLLEQAPWTKKIKSSSFNKKEKNFQFSGMDFKKTQFPIKQKEYSRELLSTLAWSEKNPDEEKQSFEISGDNPSTESLNPRSYKMAETEKKFSSKINSDFSWSSIQILAQAHLTYLICQSDNALIFIDQHASHERILYEKIFNSWKNNNVETQSHLIPMVLDLEEGQTNGLLELKPDLKKFGVELEQIGPDSLVVNTSPLILKEKALKEGLLFWRDRDWIQGSFCF